MIHRFYVPPSWTRLLVYCWVGCVISYAPAHLAMAQYAGTTGTAAPRLLFNNADLPALQAKVQSGVYAQMQSAIVGQLNSTLAPGGVMAEGTANDVSFEARNNAYLYILTGQESYAQRSLAMTKAMINDTTLWNNDSSKGLTRAAVGLAAAMSYDMCKNATSWAADKATISTLVKKNADSLMRSGGSGWPGGTGGNNWWAVRFSAAGVSYLATDDNSSTKLTGGGTATYTRSQVLAAVHNMLVVHYDQNLNSANPAKALSGDGWNGESLGYSQYPWQFTGPFALAYRRNNNIDILTAAAPTLPNVATGRPGNVGNFAAGGTAMTPSIQYSLWSNWFGAASITRTDSGHLGKGLHGDFADDNPIWNGQGTGNLSFALSPSQYVPGIRYMYDRMSGSASSGGDGYFDSDRAGGLYGILYYPTAAAQDPATIADWGHVYHDDAVGMVISRNRYRDENDIIAQIDAKSHRPSFGHSGPDSNAVRIVGLGGFWTTGSGRNGDPRGQTGLFKKDPETYTLTSDNGGAGGAGPGDVTNNRGFITATSFDSDGNGYAVSEAVNPYLATPTYLSRTEVFRHKRMLVTDYSGLSGAPGLFVISDHSESDGDSDPANGGIGKFWRLNTPEFNTVTILSEQRGEFLITDPAGDRMYARVLWGHDSTFRTGTFARGDGSAQDTGFPYGDTVYRNNKWIDFQGNDGNFLVLLALLRADDPLPLLTSNGTGVDQTITIGNRIIGLQGDVATLIAVPEPTSLSLLLIGLPALLRRRRCNDQKGTTRLAFT